MSGSKDKKDSRIKSNTVIAVFFGVLMIGMTVYFLIFLFFGRRDVLNSPYNNRFSKDLVIRGSIVTADGVEIAVTESGEDLTDRRVYPFGELFTVVTGYTDMGRTSLESSYHSALMSRDVPMLHRLSAEISSRRIRGNTVVTTIDSDLQHYCYTVLGERRGSVIAVQPSTGHILAMVSKPTFDANQVKERWSELTAEDNDSGELMNRALQGLYPPGSTFKIVTAIEYMREHPDDYQDYRYECKGSYELNGVTVRCGDGSGHGEVDLIHAMGYSCNAAFIDMGLTLDRKAYRGLMDSLGFGTRLIRDLPSSASTVTVTENTEDFELMQTAFGQGNTMETPLQNVLITAMIANHGVMMKPQIVSRIDNSEGGTVESFETDAFGSFLNEEEADYLNRCLIAVVNEGTTPQAKSPYAQVAGKSGTAQYTESFEQMHAWFTAYAPAEAPEIALTVMLEKGGSGSIDAAPLASEIISYYLSR